MQETGTQTRSYDAENLFAQQKNINWGYNPVCQDGIIEQANATENYTFDARQRVVVDKMQSDNAGNYTETLHWDDNRPLFITNASGVVDDIMMGPFADIYPQQSNTVVDFWDRDWSNSVVSVHNTTGIGKWVFPNPRRGSCDTATLGNPSQDYVGPVPQSAGNLNGPGGILIDASSNSLFDGWNNFQGLRVYDPDLGHWTAPDADKGSIYDPLSQKPYMWNRNNPWLGRESRPTSECT